MYNGVFGKYCTKWAEMHVAWQYIVKNIVIECLAENVEYNCFILLVWPS